VAAVRAHVQPFQLLPALTDEQADALRQDIAANGIIVPVVVDQHGRVIDGHNRRRIADDLGIECPTETRVIEDDDAGATLNCARRHLTREQVRDLVASEIARKPDDSDRAIARRVGCSPSTVGAVRKPQLSNLDTATPGYGSPAATTLTLVPELASGRTGRVEGNPFVCIDDAQETRQLREQLRGWGRFLKAYLRDPTPEQLAAIGEWLERHQRQTEKKRRGLQLETGEKDGPA
jgi:hypothetical protein